MALALTVIRVCQLLVIADAVLSWVQPPGQLPRSLTRALLDPVYAPVRSVLPPLPVDLAPLLALAVLYAVELGLRRKQRPARR